MILISRLRQDLSAPVYLISKIRAPREPLPPKRQRSVTSPYTEDFFWAHSNRRPFNRTHFLAYARIVGKFDTAPRGYASRRWRLPRGQGLRKGYGSPVLKPPHTRAGERSGSFPLTAATATALSVRSVTAA